MSEPPLRGEYLPLWIGGEIRGRVRRDLLSTIAGLAEFEPAEIGLQLRAPSRAGTATDPARARRQRSRQLQAIAVQLHKLGLIADWRNELCAVHDSAGVEIARCERGVFRTLGLQNRAVHVNGHRADGRWWIARRSALKRSDPGRLDNLAAGGVAAGESLRRTALRELWEEAGVSRTLAQKVDFPGMVIRSVRETQFGIHDELVIVADLTLPESFEPIGRDGEVEEFLCLSREEVEAALARGEFTVEAALATRESLARSGS